MIRGLRTGAGALLWIAATYVMPRERTLEVMRDIQHMLNDTEGTGRYEHQ